MFVKFTRFETVYFVEEVGSYVVGNNGIEVFEDKVTRRLFACFPEDLAQRVLWTHV